LLVFTCIYSYILHKHGNINIKDLIGTMNTKQTIRRLDFDQEQTHTIGALDGETLILDWDGHLRSLEELACEFESMIQVTCLDKHGRMTSALAHSFRIGEWSDEIYKISLQNGHIIQATKDQLFLAGNGEWMKAEDLNFGTVISTAIYNPRMRHPLKSMSEVEHVHKKRIDSKMPAYSFDVTTQDNLLIGQEISDNTVSLVPAHSAILR
jgi:hypothetical protein